jgi:2-amino-4-hydroxy-6-hydroxymethyldihydropteridine diphosphokinase
MEGRAFVLRPLADLAPSWRHPRTGVTISALLAALPAGQAIERL